MDLSEEEVGKILKIIDELEFTEIRLEIGDLKIHVLKDGHGRDASAVDGDLSEPPFVHPAVEAQAPADPLHSGDPAPVRPAAPSDTAHIVTSPVPGVFYRAPEPGRDPFVRVGDSVGADDTVCLIEVMKLFQSVAAGVDGRVDAVFVENGSAVDEGDLLFAIETGR